LLAYTEGRFDRTINIGIA